MEKNLDNTLYYFFKSQNIDYLNKTFVLCISTGIDSSVLLDLFMKFKSTNNINIIVCHVNHHRRKESEEEEEYIRSFCLENNIKLYVKELYFEDDTINFQAKARDLRYEFFDEVMKSEKADYLVLAHHGDDNLETILMRMTRGSSLIGYSGILACFEKNGYSVIRPLLRNSKQDIINYQKLHKIKYYEDDSNSHKDYTRNRYRLDVIPLLKKESTDIIEKVYEFSQVLRNAGNEINSIRDKFIEEYVTKDKEKIEFNRKSFLNLSLFMQEEVLFELVKKDSLSKANIEELLRIIRSDKVNYCNYFKNIFDFIIEYDRIIINYAHKEKPKEIYLEVNKLGVYNINDKFDLYVDLKDNIKVLKKEDVCYNISSLPVIVRSRKPGDKISLPQGEKKLKSLFIDMKMSKTMRDEVLILEKDECILSILGTRKSVLLNNIKDCNIVIRLKKK